LGTRLAGRWEYAEPLTKSLFFSLAEELSGISLMWSTKSLLKDQLTHWHTSDQFHFEQSVITDF
jgi:hypothetical protein